MTTELQKRVIAKYVAARGIPLGETADLEGVRIHRYADHFKIWDLTDAGKRGKSVRVMSVMTRYHKREESESWMERLSQVLIDYDDFDKIKGTIQDLMKDYPGQIEIHESKERGIDVNPGGTTTLSLKTNTGLEIKAEPLEFHVKHSWPLTNPATGKPNGSHQDTSYWGRKKKDTQEFYSWLRANLSKANRMTIEEFRQLWDSLNIDYDFH